MFIVTKINLSGKIAKKINRQNFDKIRTFDLFWFVWGGIPDLQSILFQNLSGYGSSFITENPYFSPFTNRLYP